MSDKKPPLSDEDAALWAAVTEEVKPLRKGAPRPAQTRPRHTAAPAVHAGPARAQPTGAPATRSTGTDRPAPSISRLDGRRAQRLRRGQWPIDGTIDLHGLTQARAHAALNDYLARAHAQGKRCVLVITGKGGSESEDPDNMHSPRRTGVLRRAVPGWLAIGDNAHRVVAWHPARPRHGGEGALYVVLKRVR